MGQFRAIGHLRPAPGAAAPGAPTARPGRAGQAARHGLTLIQLAVAFALNHPAVTSVIIGPRTEEHLTDYLKAADVVLSEAVLDEIDDIVAPAVNFLERDAGTVAPHLEYPELRRR